MNGTSSDFTGNGVEISGQDPSRDAPQLLQRVAADDRAPRRNAQPFPQHPQQTFWSLETPDTGMKQQPHCFRGETGRIDPQIAIGQCPHWPRNPAGASARTAPFVASHPLAGHPRQDNDASGANRTAIESLQRSRSQRTGFARVVRRSKGPKRSIASPISGFYTAHRNTSLPRDIRRWTCPSSLS